jgi:ATPase subunit of ABC transporter with duplicated ATPase domains
MWVFHQQMLQRERLEKQKQEQEAKKQQQRELRKKQAEELRRRRSSFRDDDTLSSRDESTQDEDEDDDEEVVSSDEEKEPTSATNNIPDLIPFHNKPYEQVSFAIDHVAKGFINIEGYRIITGVRFETFINLDRKSICEFKNTNTR